MISAINNVLSRGFTSFELLLNVSFILIVCLMIYIFYWHSINRSIAKINRCKINLNSGGGIYSMYAMYDQTKLYKVKYDNTTKHNVTIDCSCPAGNVPNTFKIKAYNGETDKIETVNKLSYSYLFSKAIEIIIAKLNKLITNIDNITIEPVPNNPFSVNFHVDNEDDTLGNIIQSIVHNKFIRGNEKFNKIVCSYIGYICPHPLKQLMIIRITLEEQTNPDVFKQFLTENCEAIIKELNLIDDAWIKFNSQKNKKAT